MKRGKNFIVKLLAYVAFRASVVMLGKCDLVLTVNPIVRDYLRSVRSNYEEKTLITSNGIFLENISATVPNTSYDGVFVGRLDEGKGVFELLEIVSKLKILMGDNFLLAILGTGVEEIKARLKVKIKELNLVNNIRFLGYLNDQEKYAAMKSSKCFIFPSRDESFPNVILESLACGLPTIVSDLPAYSTIFPEELVIRSHFQDIDDFSRKVFEQIRSDNVMQRKKRMEYCSALDWTEVIRLEKFNALNHLGVVLE
jgi:glycosyltransferase involved in cell wall biosynthesis